MSAPIEAVWFSLPGAIIPNPGEEFPHNAEFKAAVTASNAMTSFNRNDVFSFDGDNYMTTVIVNRLNPVWHLILMPIADFRKEFFS